jgi:hypothetical protein
MRRQKSISVKVRAPSRGLVTRLPGESADLLPSRGDVAIPSTVLSLGSLQRAAATASNVRYDNGVVRNAPGYQVVQITSSILTDILARWSLDETSGTRFDTSGSGLNLTELDGFDPLLPGPMTVAVTPGKFNGAALFNSLTYRAYVYDALEVGAGLAPIGSFISIRTTYTGDLMGVSAGLDLSFQNPTIKYVLDGVGITPGLDICTYLAATVFAATAFDAAAISAGIGTGSYTLTIVPGGTTADSMSISGGFSSGSYTLTVVPGGTESDSLAISAGIGTSAYTQTVFTVETEFDGIALTAGLLSGSYS